MERLIRKKSGTNILVICVLLALMLSMSLTADARRRKRHRKVKAVTERLAPIPKQALKGYAPIIFGADSVVMDTPLLKMGEMGLRSGAMLYISTLPQIKTVSTLTIGECVGDAQVFIDEELVGKSEAAQSGLSLQLPPVSDGQELKIIVDATGQDNATTAGLAGPVTIAADMEGNEFTLSLKRWTILTIPDDYETAMKALAATETEDSLVTVTAGKAGYYRFDAMFARQGDLFLDMSSFGRGQVFVNGNPLGCFTNNSMEPPLEVIRRFLKHGFNEVVVVDIVGPQELVLKSGDQVP